MSVDLCMALNPTLHLKTLVVLASLVIVIIPPIKLSSWSAACLWFRLGRCLYTHTGHVGLFMEQRRTKHFLSLGSNQRGIWKDSRWLDGSMLVSFAVLRRPGKRNPSVHAVNSHLVISTCTSWMEKKKSCFQRWLRRGVDRRVCVYQDNSLSLDSYLLGIIGIGYAPRFCETEGEGGGEEGGGEGGGRQISNST